MARDLDVLCLAFSRHVLDTLARADGVVERVEADFVQALCPDSALIEAGLADELGALTAAFDEAREEALERLPVELPLSERLTLVGRFLDLCIVDGHLDRGESGLLVAAAQLIGVTPQQFDRYLSSLDVVGEIELDAPLDEATDA